MVENTYWNAVLSEHANKNNKNHVFLYTSYGVKFKKDTPKNFATGCNVDNVGLSVSPVAIR